MITRHKLVEKLSFLVELLVIAVVVGQTGVAALSQNELNSIYGNTVWYSDSSPLTACNPTPGSGSPDGAAFPNLDPTAMANAIDTWVPQQNSNSELKGLGATIVASSKVSNVNPFLIVAIAHEESSLADPSDYNVSNGNNAFGRTAAPGQPSFQGSRSWYKWSSVKASVDSTAPENQGAVGGGDMATYLRAQYGSQLDSNNLVAMFMQYAPPGDNNNTDQYIANVKGWISDLVSLSNGQGNNGGDQGGGGCSSSCNAPNVGQVSGPNAAVLCEAQKYNGIYYQYGAGHEAYSTFRQICPEEAITGAASSSTADNPGPCATDCSSLVSVAIDAVYNQGFVWTVVNGSMQPNGQNWQPIPIDQAQAGDIVTTSEHVEFVVQVKDNSIYTFGSHHTGTKTSQILTPTNYWSAAYRWTGSS